MANAATVKEDMYGSNYDRRVSRLTDDMEKLANGEINAGSMTLRLAGETGGVIGDAFGLILEPVIAGVLMAVPQAAKEVVAEGIADIVEGVMDTSAAKTVVKYMKENPEVARNVGMAVSTLDIIPAQQLATGGARGIMRNVVEEIDTKLPGFYEGGLQSLKAFGKGVVGGMPAALKRFFSPHELAQAEAFGTGRGRRAEFTNTSNVSEETGNLAASSFIRGQTQNRTTPQTIIDQSPTVQGETLSRRRLSDREAIDTDLLSDVDDNPRTRQINKRMVDRQLEELGPPGPGGGKRNKVERLLRTMFTDATLPFQKKPELSGGTQVVVRDLGATRSDLRGEVRGHASVNQRGLLATQSPEIIAAYKKANNIDPDVQLDETQVADLLNSTTPYERGRWKVGGLKDKVKEIFPSVTGQKQAQILYYKLKAKDKLTDQQQSFVDLIDSSRNNNAAHVEDGVVYYSSPYASSAKDLGGVGARIAIDTRDNNRVYSSIADGHDIGGIDPAGGDSLINLTPMQSNNFGGSKEKDLKPSKTARAKEEAAADTLEERTGLQRRRETETPDQHEERMVAEGHTPRVRRETTDEYWDRFEAMGKERGAKETVKAASERTGISKRSAEPQKNYVQRTSAIRRAETPFTYQKRLFEEYVAPVLPKHRREALSNAALTGTALLEHNVEDPQMGSVWESASARQIF